MDFTTTVAELRDIIKSKHTTRIFAYVHLGDKRIAKTRISKAAALRMLEHQEAGQIVTTTTWIDSERGILAIG